MQKLLETVTRWCARHAWRVMALSTLVTLAAIWVISTKLAVVTDTDSMIDPELPFRQDYARFQAEFPQLGDTLAILVAAEVPEVRKAAVDTLVRRLNDDEEHIQSVYAPTALDFFKNNGLLFLSYEELADRMDQLVAAQPILGPMLRDPSLARLADSLSEALDNEGGDAQRKQIDGILTDLQTVIDAANKGKPGVLSFQTAFVGEGDRAFDVILVQPKLDPTKLNPAKAALLALNAHADAVAAEALTSVDISFTGKIALNADELKSVSSGAALAGLLSLALVAFILIAGLRSLKHVLATLCGLIFGLLVTGAGALLFFGSLNIISVAFAVLFIGLGIDFAIHILLRTGEFRKDHDLEDALGRAAGTSGLALAVCAPTTALAFLSFAPTGYAGLAQLGVIAAFGVFVALITSLTVLPALLALLKPRAKFFHVRAERPTMFGLPGLIITAVLAVPAIWLAAQIGFEADPISLKDSQSPSVQAYARLLEGDATSPYALQITTPSEDAAMAVVRTAKENSVIGSVVWHAGFVPAEQADKLDLIYETADLLAADFTSKGDAQQGAGEARVALEKLAAAAPNRPIAQSIETFLGGDADLDDLQRRSFATWPVLVATLERQLGTKGVAVDDLPPELASRYLNKAGVYRIELFPATPIRDEQALEAFVEDVRQVLPDVTGSPVQILESGRIVQASMVQATLTALVLVSGFLLLTLRSVKQVLLVLLPVGLAAIFTLATARIFGLNFNFANVIVLPLLLGLGVDAGIHYVKRAFEDGALHETGTTGRAVALSALTTIGSFGTLMVSSHDGTASMGLLLTIALAWLLFTTLVVLPAILAVVQKKTGAASAATPVSE